MSTPDVFFKSTDTWLHSDDQLNELYPLHLQRLAKKHWTPLAIAQKTASFLAAENGVRVLDIGCGIGKFCLGAAEFKPHSFFYGVEQRKNLVYYAEKAKTILGLENVDFLHGNFTQLNLTHYDHFYFYNSFYENLFETDKIDDTLTYSESLYHYYNRYLYRQLELMPSGTRLATFHSLEGEIPCSYHIVKTEADDLLKFWIKVN